MNFKELIGKALVEKVRAGEGSRYRKGALKKRVSKREKTRRLWAKNEDIQPWPLRPRLANKTVYDFSEDAKRERRAND